jgi:hypothetical protein
MPSFKEPAAPQRRKAGELRDSTGLHKGFPLKLDWCRLVDRLFYSHAIGFTRDRATIERRPHNGASTHLASEILHTFT